MAYLLFEHEIQDFSVWKPVYDAHEPARKRAGLKEVLLLQGAENQKFVVLLFEVQDIGKARDFLASDDLRDAMKRAGVVSKPVINFLEKAALRKAA